MRITKEHYDKLLMGATRAANDRTRLQIGFEKTLRVMGVSEKNTDRIIKDVRNSDFDKLNKLLETIGNGD